MKDDLSKLSLTVRRQAIFDRCAARYREAGTPLDENERFMMLIGQWITGGLEMREVSQRYRDAQWPGSEDRSGSISADLCELPSGRDHDPLPLISSADTGTFPSEAPSLELARMSQADLLLEIDRLIVENMPLEERQ
jgi:hypothetical protein